MKYMMLLMTKIYFRILSWLSPTVAGRQAFQVFQKTRKLPIKANEARFYASARKFNVVHPRESIHVYEVGDPGGKVVLLVHGWDSNAGSMSTIATKLADLGYRVVTFDLPAHGQSVLTHTNLKECAEALRAVVYQLRPSSLSVISHSFGSAVSTFALSGTRYKIDNFIMLTSPNQLMSIFDQFRTTIGLGDRAYEELVRLSASILNSPVSWLNVSEKLKQISYNTLTLIHDRNDRILPFSNSEEIQMVTGASLHELKQTGHYRMLHNESVVDLIANELAESHDRVRQDERSYQMAV